MRADTRAVDLLIDKGFRDIVVVDRRDWEETGGYQNEHEEVTLVGRDPDGQPVRIVFNKVVSFAPRSGGPTESFDHPQPITNDEYAAEVTRCGPVLDDAQCRAAREDRRKA